MSTLTSDPIDEEHEVFGTPSVKTSEFWTGPKIVEFLSAVVESDSKIPHSDDEYFIDLLNQTRDELKKNPNYIGPKQKVFAPSDRDNRLERSIGQNNKKLKRGRLLSSSDPSLKYSVKDDMASTKTSRFAMTLGKIDSYKVKKLLATDDQIVANQEQLKVLAGSFTNVDLSNKIIVDITASTIIYIDSEEKFTYIGLKKKIKVDSDWESKYQKYIEPSDHFKKHVDHVSKKLDKNHQRNLVIWYKETIMGATTLDYNSFYLEKTKPPQKPKPQKAAPAGNSEPPPSPNKTPTPEKDNSDNISEDGWDPQPEKKFNVIEAYNEICAEVVHVLLTNEYDGALSVALLSRDDTGVIFKDGYIGQVPDSDTILAEASTLVKKYCSLKEEKKQHAHAVLASHFKSINDAYISGVVEELRMTPGVTISDFGDLLDLKLQPLIDESGQYKKNFTATEQLTKAVKDQTSIVEDLQNMLAEHFGKPQSARDQLIRVGKMAYNMNRSGVELTKTKLNVLVDMVMADASKDDIIAAMKS